MSVHDLCLMLTALLPLTDIGWPQTTHDKPVLTAQDKEYLEGLMKEFVFDPKGAVRVRVKTIVRTAWGASDDAPSEGWLVVGKDGRDGRVYFTDGESIPAPAKKQMEKINFNAACMARYTAKPKQDEKSDVDAHFRGMERTAVGAVETEDLALACWLYRFGEEQLAATALAAARAAEGDPRKRLRGELAWSAYVRMIHAYIVRADDEALAHGERLLRLYAEKTTSADNGVAARNGQATHVMEELRRRQKKRTFGKTPPAGWPDGFEAWELKKKAAFLIDALEEVDARQSGQPGGVDLASDRRVAELIHLGDPVVPDLLEVLEKDTRLTRSVHFWRDFAPSRTVLSVREAALTALMSILRVRTFEPSATGDNFTRRGEQEAQDMAKRLRAYWNEYGRFPFDERMMEVLTDPQTTFDAKREAAFNLAHLGEGRTMATTVFGDRTIGERHGANPAIAKFKKPTAAEAILAAMDGDLRAFDKRPVDRLTDYHRRHIEDNYLFALITLDDQRIAEVLAQRSRSAATTTMRRKWAFGAHRLGASQPLKDFAIDFRAGKIVLPANNQPQTNENDQPGNVELLGIIRYLSSAATPEAERALYALANHDHPYHKMAADRVLQETVDWTDSMPWFAHPYCVAILREQLENTERTGGVYRIEQDRLTEQQTHLVTSGTIPDLLADPATRRDQAPQRVCDLAAEKLSRLVIGLPRYHALRKDSDARLKEMKTTLDRFAGTLRSLHEPEARVLGAPSWEPCFIADVRPLGRPAGADDVKAGKAVFHLHGNGKLADLKLPAVATWKQGEAKQGSNQVLVIQAEVGPDGMVTYGIIGRQSIRSVKAPELTDITPLADSEKLEKNGRGK